jgi:hypothetical protein
VPEDDTAEPAAEDTPQDEQPLVVIGVQPQPRPTYFNIGPGQADGRPAVMFEIGAMPAVVFCVAPETAREIARRFKKAALGASLSLPPSRLIVPNGNGKH